MAYDEHLGERTRAAVGALGPAEEKKMFGGLAFMVNTHMAVGIIGDGLMVRVGDEGYDDALARGAEEMTVFSGRPMRGMVIVPGPMVAQDEELADWVGRGVGWANAQAPKAPKARKAPKAPPKA